MERLTTLPEKRVFFKIEIIFSMHSIRLSTVLIFQNPLRSVPANNRSPKVIFVGANSLCSFGSSKSKFQCSYMCRLDNQEIELCGI